MFPTLLCASIFLSPLVVRMSGQEDQAQLVLAIKEHFRTKCVSVVVNPGFAQYARPTRNLLAKLQGDAALLNGNVVSSRHSAVQRCQHNRPLYVLFASEGTKDFLKGLNKIPSYPRWLLFLDSATSMRELMNQVYIPFDCEFLLAEEKSGVMELLEVYMVSPSTQFTQVHFGSWSKEKGLQATNLSLYDRRNNLQGTTLRAAIAESAPFNIFREGGIAKGDIDGYLGKLWKILQNMSNFTTKYVTPADGAWGSKLPNGSWNGMVGMVVGKQAQITASEFTMTTSRLREVDYLLPIAFSSFSILIRQPEGLTLEWTDLAAPLASGMWAATLAFILCAAVALLAASRASVKHGRSADFCLSDAFLQVFGPFCNQGSATVLLSLSSRAVFLMACMTSLVVVAAYSASLISILTIQKKALPFDSLRGFAADGSYRLGMMDKSAALALFQNATDPLFIELYHRFVLPELGRLSLDDKVGLRRLCTEDKFAFVTTSLYARNYLPTLPCVVTWLPEAIMRETTSFIIEKESPYRGIFDHNLRRLRDTGVLDKLRQEAWPSDAEDLHQSFTEIRFNDVIPVLALLASGVVLAVSALFVELNLSRLIQLPRFLHSLVAKR